MGNLSEVEGETVTINDLYFYAAMFVVCGYLFGMTHAWHIVAEQSRKDRARALERFKKAIDKVGF